MFTWEDGSSINYWESNEPNNSGGNSTFVKEGCVGLFPNGLDDDDCAYYHNIFCQVPL